MTISADNISITEEDMYCKKHSLELHNKECPLCKLEKDNPIVPKVFKCLSCKTQYVIPLEFIERNVYDIELKFCDGCKNKISRAFKSHRQMLKEEVEELTNVIRILDSYKEYFKKEELDKRALEVLNAFREIKE